MKFSDEDQHQSTTPDSHEACQSLLRDFPNALDNHKICNKVKESGQFLDWLRDNSDLCEQSGDHYSEFMQHSCSPVFCREAELQHANWKREFAENCQGGTTQNCKNIENKLKAFEHLSCTVDDEASTTPPSQVQFGIVPRTGRLDKDYRSLKEDFRQQIDSL